MITHISKKRKLLLVSITLFLFSISIIHFLLPRIIIEIKNPIVEHLRSKKTVELAFDNNPKNGEVITFKSFDSLKLTAFLTYAKTDSVKGTIILLHGIRSYKEHFISISTKLATEGYNAIALDSRAHGNSEGRFCTFGINEKKDVSALITLLIKEEKTNANIGVWGQSLGGAIGLQAMGTDKRIKFGVIESTFSDFRSVTNDYVEYHLGFNIPLLTHYLVYRAGVIGGFNPEDAKPLNYCNYIDQPILIVHGDKDKRISIHYGKENFEMIKSKNKEFITVKGANHLSVWNTGGTDYFNTVYNFIENIKSVNKKTK